MNKILLVIFALFLVTAGIVYAINQTLTLIFNYQTATSHFD